MRTRTAFLESWFTQGHRCRCLDGQVRFGKRLARLQTCPHRDFPVTSQGCFLVSRTSSKYSSFFFCIFFSFFLSYVFFLSFFFSIAKSTRHTDPRLFLLISINAETLHEFVRAIHSDSTRVICNIPRGAIP